MSETYFEFRVYDMYGKHQRNILAVDLDEAWELAVKDAEANGYVVADLVEI